MQGEIERSETVRKDGERDRGTDRGAGEDLKQLQTCYSSVNARDSVQDARPGQTEQQQMLFTPITIVTQHSN